MNPNSMDAGAIAMCTTIDAPKNIKSRELCAIEGTPGAVFSLRLRALKTSLGNGLHIAGHHVAGDMALDYFMDAVEESGLSLEEIHALRLQSDHCHQVRQDQIIRAKRLKWTFSCDASPEVNEVILNDYGEEYLTRYAPFKSMLDAGMHPLISEFGSQVRVRNSPFESGYSFLTRRSVDGKTPIGAPEEAIPDRMTMLLMMTRWGAYSMLKEDKLGSLEVNKLADLVVLDNDVLSVPIGDVPNVKPIMTMVGGKIVFEDPAFRGNILRFNTQTANWEKEVKTESALWRW